MPLRLTRSRIRYMESLRLAVVAAERDGVAFNVLIPGSVLNYLARKRDLSKEEACSVVARHEVRLQEAADRVFLRQEFYGKSVPIVLGDIVLDAALPAAEIVEPLRQSPRASPQH